MAFAFAETPLMKRRKTAAPYAAGQSRLPSLLPAVPAVAPWRLPDGGNYFPSTLTSTAPSGGPTVPAGPQVTFTPGQMGDPNATSPPGTGDMTTGTSTNYQDLLNQDPFYKQWLANMQAQSAADLAARNYAIQRALISFGEVPGDLNVPGLDLSGVLDDATRQLIAQNTTAGLSTTARLQQQDVQAQRSINNALAARDMAYSGETGFQLGREQQQYTQAQYDARQRLLDALLGYETNYAAAEQARQQALLQAAQQAYQNQLALAQLRAQVPAPGGPDSQSMDTSTPAPTQPATSYQPGSPSDRMPSEGGALLNMPVYHTYPNQVYVPPGWHLKFRQGYGYYASPS